MIIRGITSLSDHSGKSDGGGGLYIKGTVFGSTGRSFGLGSVFGHLSSVLISDHRPAFPIGSGCRPAFPVASVHAPFSIRSSIGLPLSVGSVTGLPSGIASYA